MSRLAIVAIVAVFVFSLSQELSAAEGLQITVAAGKHARRNTPVHILVKPSKELLAVSYFTLTGPDGLRLPAQLTAPGLLAKTNDPQVRELHFVLPELAAGASLTLKAELTAEAQPSFAWTDTAGKYAELSFAGRKTLRYMYEALDRSTNERRMETYKIYHHVYDPSGSRFVTKGAGGLFPHHRGLFYGFNRISYGEGQQADVWHCNKGESQSHEEFVSQETGPVVGRHRLKIAWRGRDGKPFAIEQRELAVYNTPGGLLIEFASRLESKVGKVRLDGDPQHAGFQFRASQDVPDKTRKLTYYVRPDGADKPGSFRNWPANQKHINLPWHALSFVLDDQRYTCCYLDRSQNPKPSRFSERDYGRFGSYFEYELDEKTPLELNYRVWLQEGELGVAGIARHAVDFAEPPVVEVSAGGAR